MGTQRWFLPIEFGPMAGTRDALHAYAGILGDWLKSCRPRRKHWWHASLRPSLAGLSTGVVHAGTEFELELDLRATRQRVFAISFVKLHSSALRDSVN